jgi:hypothetical protein
MATISSFLQEDRLVMRQILEQHKHSQAELGEDTSREPYAKGLWDCYDADSAHDPYDLDLGRKQQQGQEIIIMPTVPRQVRNHLIAYRKELEEAEEDPSSMPLQSYFNRPDPKQSQVLRPGSHTFSNLASKSMRLNNTYR